MTTDETTLRRFVPTDEHVWAQDVAVAVDVLRSRLAARQAALGPDVPQHDSAVLAGV